MVRLKGGSEGFRSTRYHSLAQSWEGHRSHIWRDISKVRRRINDRSHPLRAVEQVCQKFAIASTQMACDRDARGLLLCAF